MNRRVIATKNLPAQFPVSWTVLAWLLLDRLRPPGWVWGAVGAVFALLWILLMVAVFTQESVDILAERGR